MSTTLALLISDVARNLDAFDNKVVVGGGATQLEIRDGINRALRRIFYQTITPLTLVVDGDMETSGVTNWAQTNCTASKLSTGLDSVLYGTQSLRVLNTLANGYAQSATIPVVPSTSYYLQARVRAVVGTATLIAYDVTNAASIESDTWTNSGWGAIAFNFTLPSTCESLAIQLKGTGATDDIYWDHIILLRSSAREIPLPSWITTRNQIQSVYVDIPRANFDRDLFATETEWDYRPDMSNPNYSYWISLPVGINGPVWIEVSRPYPALTAATDTTLCDRELAGLGGTVETLRMMMRHFPGDAGIILRQDYADYVHQFRARQAELRPPRQIHYQWHRGADVPQPIRL